jgi:hypothetical protein
MKTPQGMYTIAEAADLWINLIQAWENATQIEKDILIGKIRAATPKTEIVGVGGTFDASTHKMPFSEACNNIKRIIRSL